MNMLQLAISFSRHLKFRHCRILTTINMLRLAISLSVAAYLLTLLRFRPGSDARGEMELPSSKPSESGGEEKQVSTVDPDVMSEEYNAAETKILKNIVLELQRKEENLQGELLDYYGLMEQETRIIELQKQLKLNAVEIEMLNLKVNYLETQKKEVEREVEKSSLALEYARSKIKELQRHMQMESMQIKEQLVMLNKKLQTSKELEIEVVGLRRTNKELQLERRELMLKLDIAETQIASLSVITEAREEVNTQANADLLKQVEGLEDDRLNEIEELVYLRSVSAGLRY